MSLWRECRFKRVMFIDIHAHYCKQNTSICVRNFIIGKDDWNPDHYFTAGIHPWNIHDTEEQLKILQHLISHPKNLAIGECGIDKNQGASLSIQQKIFEQQCELAAKFQKPIVIHAVKSHFECIAILKKYSLQKVVFHGFNNRYTILDKILQEGYSVSLGAAVLNEKSQAHALAKLVPIDQLYLETDDYEGEIEDIYSTIAKEKGISINDLSEQISINFKQFFNPNAL